MPEIIEYCETHQELLKKEAELLELLRLLNRMTKYKYLNLNFSSFILLCYDAEAYQKNKHI